MHSFNLSFKWLMLGNFQLKNLPEDNLESDRLQTQKFCVLAHPFEWVPPKREFWGPFTHSILLPGKRRDRQVTFLTGQILSGSLISMVKDTEEPTGDQMSPAQNCNILPWRKCHTLAPKTMDGTERLDAAPILTVYHQVSHRKAGNH